MDEDVEWALEIADSLFDERLHWFGDYCRAQYIYSDHLWVLLGDEPVDVVGEWPLSEQPPGEERLDPEPFAYDITESGRPPRLGLGVDEQTECGCEGCQHPDVAAEWDKCRFCATWFKTTIHAGCPFCRCPTCGEWHTHDQGDDCSLDAFA